MPVTKSAKKAAKQAISRTKRNAKVKVRYKKSMKELMKAIEQGEQPEKLRELLNKVYGELDRAMKKNLLHGNNVARKKSRMASLVKSGLSENKKVSETEMKESEVAS